MVVETNNRMTYYELLSRLTTSVRIVIEDYKWLAIEFDYTIIVFTPSTYSFFISNDSIILVSE